MVNYTSMYETPRVTMTTRRRGGDEGGQYESVGADDDIV